MVVWVEATAKMVQFTILPSSPVRDKHTLPLVFGGAQWVEGRRWHSSRTSSNVLAYGSRRAGYGLALLAVLVRSDQTRRQKQDGRDAALCDLSGQLS